MPIASILIPVFNREDLIGRCIESAQSQTIKNIDIIIVDNNSNDNTFKIAADYASADNRIKLYRNDTNIGPVRNWIECVKHSKSEYSKILFSDDLISPNFLEKTIPQLVDPNCGFVYSTAVVGREPWNGVIQYKAFEGNTKFNKDYYIRAALLIEHFCPVSPGAALFRTNDLAKNIHTSIEGIDNYDFNATGAGVDYLIYLLTSLNYPYIAYIDQPLSFFHAHKNSISGSSENGQVELGYSLAIEWLKSKLML